MGSVESIWVSPISVFSDHGSSKGRSMARHERSMRLSFRTYVEKVHLPVLRPRDIVIPDNIGSHRSKAVRQLIRSVGAGLSFLPKYSPDLNPIEQVFAKLKHLLRNAAARTVDAV